MFLIRAIAVFSLLMISGQSLAYQVAGVTLSRVHVNIGAGYYLSTTSTMVGPDGCGSTNWYKLQSDAYSDAAFSTALAAKMSGKKITLYLDGCIGQFPRLIWLNLHD